MRAASDKPPETPVNPPAFRRWRDEVWVEVPASEWRKLAPKLKERARLAPEAPARDPMQQYSPQRVDYGDKGPGRAQRVLEKREIPLGPKWGKLSGLGESFTYWSSSPQGWGPSDVVVAFGQARRILREIGLPRDANAVWCYREKGQWWVLIDRDGSLDALAPDAEPESPGAAGADLFALYYRDGPVDILRDLPPQFLEDYGGHGGAFEWAWRVRSLVVQLVKLNHKSRAIARWLRRLTELPEWGSLRRAVSGTGVAGLAPGNLFHFIDEVAASGGREAVGPAFIEGYQLGHAFGALEVLRSVAQGEMSRNPGKKDLRAALRAIAAEEAARGPLRPYVLAQALIAERGLTERGKRLADLGLASDFNRVGTMIKEEAVAAGLLQS